jgi:hypothetical protein
MLADHIIRGSNVSRHKDGEETTMKAKRPDILRIGSGERGTALVMALFLITILTVIGTMVLNTSIVEIKMAQNQKISSQVFFAAEAGLERLLLMHIKDFELDSGANSPWANDSYVSWAESVTTVVMSGSESFNADTRSMDMYIDGNDSNLKKLTLGGGHTVNNCTFDLYKYIVDATEVYIMSRATGSGGMAAVEYHLMVDNAAPYDNAIFTDSGISGHFQGSVNVAGSIYSRGDLHMGANVHISNSYDPPIAGNAWDTNATIQSILEEVEDLDAKIRVNDGELTVGSASTQIGYAGTNGAIEGIYADGGFDDGGYGTTHYYDEYQNEVPDLDMPSILDGLNDYFGASTITTCIASEGYSGDDSAIAASLYADWAETGGCFTTSTGYVYDGDLTLDKNTASFAFTDSLGNGIIYVAPPGGEGMGELTIQGTVVINGDFTFGDNKLDGLDYTATGIDDGSGSDAADGATLFVNGDFNAEGEFYPSDGYLKGDLYPGTNDINSLGVVVTDDVDFTGHNDDVIAGFFFIDDTVYFTKQVKFAGTVIAGGVDFTQVPDVFQVPNLSNYLPPGVPGGYDVFQLSQREWRRVY